MRWDSRPTNRLSVGDTIVIYRDDDAHLHVHTTFGAPVLWRRVPAIVVDLAELDLLATHDELGDLATSVRGFGEAAPWQITFEVDSQRYEIPQVSAHFYFEILGPHHPVCSACGEPWPCREDRQDAEALRFTHLLDDLCDHCGTAIGGAWSTTFHDGVRRRKYHLAQKYRGPDRRRCKDVAAEARASSLSLSGGQSDA